jgi:hypothetical protein
MSISLGHFDENLITLHTWKISVVVCFADINCAVSCKLYVNTDNPGITYIKSCELPAQQTCYHTHRQANPFEHEPALLFHLIKYQSNWRKWITYSPVWSGYLLCSQYSGGGVLHSK